MRLKLIFVDRDSMNRRKVIREECLEGESEKPLTKNRILKMVKRFHPEFGRPIVIDVSRFQEDSEITVQWLVHSEQLGPNLLALRLCHTSAGWIVGLCLAGSERRNRDFSQGIKALTQEIPGYAGISEKASCQLLVRRQP